MASTFVTCPYCGASNEPGSAFCANCGKSLPSIGGAPFDPRQGLSSSPTYPGMQPPGNNMPSSAASPPSPSSPSFQTGGANIPPPPYGPGNMPSSPNFPGNGQFYSPSPYPTGNLSPTPPPAPQPKRKVGLIVIIAILAIVLVAGGALASALILNSNKSTANTPTATSTTGNTPAGSTATAAQATSTSQSVATAIDTSTASTGTTPVDTSTTTTNPISPQTALPCTVNVGAWTDGSADWKVLNGMLLNDGTNGNSPFNAGPSIVAPCQPAATSNYAVEAKIQVISGTNGCFGFTVRGNPLTSGWQGYMAGVGQCYSNGMNEAYIGGPGYSNESASVQAAFSPGTSVHTYRIEAKNNVIKLYVDNSLLLTLTDNRFLDGAQIGLWDQSIQLQVTSFQVTGL